MFPLKLTESEIIEELMPLISAHELRRVAAFVQVMPGRQILALRDRKIIETRDRHYPQYFGHPTIVADHIAVDLAAQIAAPDVTDQKGNDLACIATLNRGKALTGRHIERILDGWRGAKLK